MDISMNRVLIGTFVPENNPVECKPDKDGYYYVNVGALNVANTSGVFYEAPEVVLELFKSTSIAVKRLRERRLYGESKHPNLENHKGNNAAGIPKWIVRQTHIDSDRHAIHIRSFDLFETDITDTITGKKKILIKAWLKPYGPYGPVVQESFDNPNMDTCFSLRAVAIERMEQGRRIRRITSAVTWDFVPAPGIPGSSSQHSDNFRAVTEEDMAILEDIQKSGFQGVANEDIDDLNSTINNLKGLKKPDITCKEDVLSFVDSM